MGKKKDIEVIDGQLKMEFTSSGEFFLKEYKAPFSKNPMSRGGICEEKPLLDIKIKPSDLLGQDEQQKRDDIIKLLDLWLDFLRCTGLYSSKYGAYASYLSQKCSGRVRELVNDISATENTLQYYIARMEDYLTSIEAMQRRCGQKGFSLKREYREKILTALTSKEQNGRKRREEYRKIIRRELKKNEPQPVTLNDLEAGYQAKVTGQG